MRFKAWKKTLDYTIKSTLVKASSSVLLKHLKFTKKKKFVSTVLLCLLLVKCESFCGPCFLILWGLDHIAS